MNHPPACYEMQTRPSPAQASPLHWKLPEKQIFSFLVVSVLSSMYIIFDCINFSLFPIGYTFHTGKGYDDDDDDNDDDDDDFSIIHD